MEVLTVHIKAITESEPSQFTVHYNFNKVNLKITIFSFIVKGIYLNPVNQDRICCPLPLHRLSVHQILTHMKSSCKFYSDIVLNNDPLYALSNDTYTTPNQIY